MTTLGRMMTTTMITMKMQFNVHLSSQSCWDDNKNDNNNENNNNDNKNDDNNDYDDNSPALLELQKSLDEPQSAPLWRPLARWNSARSGSQSPVSETQWLLEMVTTTMIMMGSMMTITTATTNSGMMFCSFGFLKSRTVWVRVLLIGIRRVYLVQFGAGN